MTITVLITGIYHYFPLLTILCSLCLQQAPQLGWAFTWCDLKNIHSQRPWALNGKQVSSHFLLTLKSLSTYHFLTFPVINFPSMFLSSSWPSSQTIGHSPGLRVSPHIWPFFLWNKMYNQVFFSHLYSLEGFLFSTVVQRCPEEVP